MSEAEHLSRALRGFFANPQNGWFPPFTDAIAGLTVAQASWIPAPEMNSVWALTNHVRFYQELILLRLRGEPVDRRALGAENGWPPPGDPADEGSWQASCHRAQAVNEELAALLAGLSDQVIAQPIQEGKANPWQFLHGLIAHTAYHTGQIIMTRRLQDAWILDWRERQRRRST